MENQNTEVGELLDTCNVNCDAWLLLTQTFLHPVSVNNAEDAVNHQRTQEQFLAQPIGDDDSRPRKRARVTLSMVP